MERPIAEIVEVISTAPSASSPSYAPAGDRRAFAGAAKPGVPFSEIAADVRTYDLLLFRGSDFVSDAIANVEEHYVGVRDFTHVGVAVRPRDLPAGSKYRRPGDGGVLYALESTASGKLGGGAPSVIDSRGHLGVQLRDMAAVVPSYDASPKTRMAYMPLQDSARPAPDPAALEAVLDRYLGVEYDANCVDLFAAASPCMRCVRDTPVLRRLWRLTCFLCCCQTRPVLFCSELAAHVYIDVGVFPDTVVPADCMPVDFLPELVTPLLLSDGSVAAAAEPLERQKTVDADGQVPWVFKTLVRFRADEPGSPPACAMTP